VTAFDLLILGTVGFWMLFVLGLLGDRYDAKHRDARKRSQDGPRWR